VDTNVAVVANGRTDASRGARPHAIACRIAAVERLMHVLRSGTVVLDAEGAIAGEYHRHLNPRGQPGVGDRFYQQVLNSAPGRVERVDLPKAGHGGYADFPDHPDLADFDPSDRKFAALARRERIPVVTATDSDWLAHRAPLGAHGVRIDFVCGCDSTKWFQT